MAEQLDIFEIKIETGDSKQEVSKLSEQVLALTNSIKTNNQVIKDAEKSNKALIAENKQLNSSVKDGNITRTEANKKIDENNKAIRANNSEIKDLQKQTLLEKDKLKDLNQERNRAVNVVKTQQGSLNALRIETSKLTKERNELDLRTKEGRTSFKDLTKQIDSNNKAIRQADKAAGDYKSSIGNYSDALEGSNTVMGRVLTGFKAFIANPIGLAIVAIAGGLKLLFDAFKRSNEGQTILAKGMGILEGVITVISKAFDKFAKLIISAFENPKQAIADLWQAIKTNISNRLEGFIEQWVSLGKVLKGVFTLDWDKVEEGAKEFGNALVKLGTGFDAEDIVDGFNKITDSINDTVNSSFNLKLLKRNADLLEISLIRSNATLQKQRDLLEAVADDATKSFAERENAARKLFDIGKKQLNDEIKLASDRENILKAQSKAQNDNSIETQKSIAESTAARIGKETELQNFIRENEKRLSELKQDRLERDLDFEIDITDKRKSIIERQLMDETMSFEERQKLLDEADNLIEDSFVRQIGIIQQFTDAQIDANALVSESNAAVLMEKVRALGTSEIIEGRILEVIKERQTFLQDLDEAEKDFLAKRFARKQKELEISLSELENNAKIIENSRSYFIVKKSILTQAFEAEQRLREEQLQLKLITQEEFDTQEKEALIEHNAELDELELARKEAEQEERLTYLEGTQMYYSELRDIENESYQLRLEALKSFGLSEKELQAVREEERKAHEKRLSDISTKANVAALDKTKQSLGMISQFVSNVNQTELNNLAANRQRQLDVLQGYFDRGLITQEEYELNKAEIEKKAAKESYEIQLRQFRLEKATALATIAIDTAVAVMKALRNPPGPPYTIPASIAAGVLGAGQAALVISQSPPPPTFKEGGAVIGGKPHSQGGTKFYGEDGTVFEAEKDEGIFITKKEATIRALSEINQSYGGRSMYGSAPVSYFQEGGAVPAGNGLSSSALTAALKEAIGTLPPQVVQVVDIQAGLTANRDALNVAVV